ncbi:NIC-domain-containing protein [Metschnikowia bicuspidata var. bicuspidata NRRL YB-4993]|uniref:Nuclear pore protein n=1 Tax=Metschnikowia bicuspidata var. bicuspidata NRRL YB-4993 TaxID=869754 RepID=A0A1A0H934_9ASCO|nr:NIC-domain-containing protein [Metschnikowia bicuspidata var. bicuspidata NRRL YB-4993]OBA20393.1 NIC-domain-containing protein [Metschnikowia bicuspidata var. bicuspidata NRRL YB-4993]
MSLFSAQPPTQQSTQPSSFGSAFGSTQQNQPFSSAGAATTNTPNSSGNAAGTPASAAAAPFAPAFPKNGVAAPALPAQITPDASSTRILKDLLDSAHNLPKLHHGSIGPISLPLSELRKETLQLRKNEKHGGNHTKAHYLLSKSGVNASDFEAELDALPRPQGGEAGAENTGQNYARDVETSAEREDIENYLGAKKDETVLSAIEQSLVSASRDFDRFINLSVAIDWKVRKDNLKRQLGIPVRTKITSEELAKSFTWNKSLPGASRVLAPLALSKTAANSTRHVSRDKFESNARVVYKLNESRLENRPFPLCLSFADLCKTSADSKSKQMGEIWRILADLSDEKLATVNQEQLFFESYQGAQPEKTLRKQVVKHSKLALELQFFNYMDEIYTKDDQKPPEFQPATNINKVSYFIHKVITKNNDSKLMERTLNYNGVPIWALVFYLMRSGLYAEAVDLTQANEEAFNKFDKNFPIYMSHFFKLGCFDLPSELHERISSDYSQSLQYLNEDAATFDPYKYAVYKIIGKCDLVKKNLPAALNLSIEDWLWFHLLILNEFGSTAASDLLYENYRLESLQKKVVSSGPARFNASSNHPVYAKTLVMLGLYELAVQYVYENINECDAVHLAIALSYYGLLKSSKSTSDDLIVVDSNDAYQVNFSRLLGSYTRTFKISDPKVAAQYLILICLSKGGHNAEESVKCHDALRELILISREFGLLLGDLNPDTGDKVPGILEHQRALINLPDIKKFYSQITERSAQRCEEEGRAFDALRLYQLCQEYDTVVSLLNKFLSEILSMTELDKPLLTGATYRTPEGGMQPVETSENNLILLARKLKGIFERNSFISGQITPKEKEINEYLLPMVDIRDRFVKKDWQGALDGIKNLGLVPIVDTDDFIEVRRAAEALNGYDVKLVKVIPSVLMIVMTSIAQINHNASTKKFGMGGQERGELDKLKTIAKNCMVYAGMIQYRMPRETYSLLINLEALL